jgi:hypothetical protein
MIRLPDFKFVYFPINFESAPFSAELPASPYAWFTFWSSNKFHISEPAYHFGLIQNLTITVFACNNFVEMVNNF